MPTNANVLGPRVIVHSGLDDLTLTIADAESFKSVLMDAGYTFGEHAFGFGRHVRPGWTRSMYASVEIRTELERFEKLGWTVVAVTGYIGLLENIAKGACPAAEAVDRLIEGFFGRL